MNNLTERENQIIELVEKNLTTSEISVQLGISKHTVKAHIITIQRKLGVNILKTK